jgi:hypothetical protein
VSRVEREIEIAVPPEVVYDKVMDASSIGDWVSIHEQMQEAPNRPLEQGDELKQRLRVAGQRFSVKWKVAVADRPRHVVWEGRGPMRSKARAEYRFEPSGEGTRFLYANEFDGPLGKLGDVATKMVAPAAGRESEATLKRLKELLEA